MKHHLIFFFLLFSVVTIAQPTVTEVFYPQYVQGVGTGNPPDDRKVPFACRMQLNGLAANATYRYYSRFTDNPASSNNGIGAYIIANKTGNFRRVTSASLAQAGAYGEFTTNASGSVTEWFICEPSSDTRFAPTLQLYWRIILNNGAGGTAVTTRITSTNPVTVLGWGSGPMQGTGLRISAVSTYTAKNFVMLFDNAGGTGRPVAGSFIESDGTVNGSALNGDPFTAGYAPFYGDNVDGVDKTWGTIIPNNLANGVRLIAQYDLNTGDQVSVITSENGEFPGLPSGTVSTVNTTSGLSALAINGSINPLPVTLKSFTALLQADNKVSIQWETILETNTDYFIAEKSVNGRDFNSIGKLNPKGSNSSYQLPDVLSSTLAYYRLKLVDKDGKFKYSKIVAVNAKLNKGLSLYPNPAVGEINISHPEVRGLATVTIVSMSGAVVARQILLEGSKQNTLPVSLLSKGKYVLVYKNGLTNYQVSFTKL